MRVINKQEVLICKNCITGAPDVLRVSSIAGHEVLKKLKQQNLYIGPGLFDLQINGINGIDFNNTALKAEELEAAAYYLLKRGVTAFLPTVITNAKENLMQILRTIDEACHKNNWLAECVAGVHLEGPFISGEDGARGAHPSEHICDPDWDFFKELQQVSGNRIKLITVAPERNGSAAFIRQCVAQGVRVAVGHSICDSVQLQEAIDAGAEMSTHLGNGVPLMLKRHSNILWEQLAEDALYAGFITDGIHIPESFLKVALRMKGDKAILVSDATQFAGMPPGDYTTHIGGSVVLNEQGQLSVKGEKGILAGAAKDLLQCVEWLSTRAFSSLSHAWRLASMQPAAFVKQNISRQVLFEMQQQSIHIIGIVQNSTLIYVNDNNTA